MNASLSLFDIKKVAIVDLLEQRSASGHYRSKFFKFRFWALSYYSEIFVVFSFICKVNTKQRIQICIRCFGSFEIYIDFLLTRFEHASLIALVKLCTNLYLIFIRPMD